MQEPVKKMKVLFLCTGNSCRSQMAEAWTRYLLPERVEAYSAGIMPQGLDPLAAEVMGEAGVDMSGQKSKSVDDLAAIPFDLVITVCSGAYENCPVFPGRTRVIHRGFDDSPRLAKTVWTVEEKKDCYRRVRDEIRAFVLSLPEMLRNPG